jgi:histidine triad (HIT) family protein
MKIITMTIFAKIIAGQIPAYKIAENEKFLAFLDVFPLTHGHTLVIPKIEVDKFFDMPAGYLNEILAFAKPIADAIEKAFTCKRVGLSVIGLEVPHAHLHLLPLNSIDDITFTNPKMKPAESELKEAQQKIIAAL